MTIAGRAAHQGVSTYNWELESEPRACEGCICTEGFGGSTVSYVERPEVFEPVEATFDAVALLVEHAVVAARRISVLSRRDHRRRAEALHLGDVSPNH